MPFYDERVQVDHLGVRVQGGHDGFASDARGQSGHRGEMRSLRHLVGLVVEMKENLKWNRTITMKKMEKHTAEKEDNPEPASLYDHHRDSPDDSRPQ